MNGKIARIQDMTAQGWVIEDLQSEHGEVEVLLARGKARATVTLDRFDAWQVVFGDGLVETKVPERRAIVLER